MKKLIIAALLGIVSVSALSGCQKKYIIGINHNNDALADWITRHPKPIKLLGRREKEKGLLVYVLQDANGCVWVSEPVTLIIK